MMVLLRMSGGKEKKVVVGRLQEGYRGRPSKGHTADKAHPQHYIIVPEFNSNKNLALSQPLDRFLGGFFQFNSPKLHQ